MDQKVAKFAQLETHHKEQHRAKGSLKALVAMHTNPSFGIGCSIFLFSLVARPPKRGGYPKIRYLWSFFP